MTSTPETHPEISPATKTATEFVAANYISCDAEYREGYEPLCRTRAHAIGRPPGIPRMMVLQPEREGGDYLVVGFWDQTERLERWRTSPELAEGHRRGFDDVRRAREGGKKPPMTSRMELYSVLCE